MKIRKVRVNKAKLSDRLDLLEDQKEINAHKVTINFIDGRNKTVRETQAVIAEEVGAYFGWRAFNSGMSNKKPKIRSVFDHNEKTLWDLSAEREQPMSEEEIEEIRREIVK